jgi:hypothetical protein
VTFFQCKCKRIRPESYELGWEVGGQGESTAGRALSANALKRKHIHNGQKAASKCMGWGVRVDEAEVEVTGGILF